jgi:hypothetical protein
MLIALAWITSRFLGMVHLGSKWGSALRQCIVPIAAYAGVSIGLLAFRLCYFGYPLPNTYYAKVSPSLSYNLRVGIGYAKWFVLSDVFVGAAVGAALVFVLELLWRAVKPRQCAPAESATASVSLWRARMFVFSAALLAGVATPILTGGDHFVLFRFYQPLWPMFAVPLLAVVAWWSAPAEVPEFRGLPEPRRRTALSPALFLVVYMIYVANQPRWDRFYRGSSELGSVRWEYKLASTGRSLGDELNRVMGSGPAPTIGVITAGGVAVTYRGPIIDLMGLNNVRMGHSLGDRSGFKNHAAFNQEVFHELAPDLVIPTETDDANGTIAVFDGRTDAWSNGILRGLLETQRFRGQYVTVFLPSPGKGAKVGIVAYCKRGSVEQLRARGVILEVSSKRGSDEPRLSLIGDETQPSESQ